MLCSFTFCFFFGAIFLLPIMEVHASVANIYNLQNIYLLKVNKINTEKRCEIGSKLTKNTSKRCERWTYFPPFSSFSNFNFEHVIVNWEYMQHF